MTLASNLLLTSLPLLISMYANRYREEDLLKAFPDNPPDYNLPVLESFDYIVVGGGTAGCIVARRLADANFKVLLLEAGGTPPPIQYVPVVAGALIQEFHPEVNFLYRTVPQRHAEQRNQGIAQTAASKMLGGGSSHNTLTYHRGSPYDYDGWADNTGDESWRYSRILKYFRKFENYNGNFSSTNSDQHGVGGLVTITSPYFAQNDIWLQAGQELSYPIADPNGPQKISFFPNINFLNFGRRVDTYEAYIKPVEKSYEGTLDVRRYSVVSKVLFEKKTARGVLYHRHGIPKVAMATREVILCAGSFVSPILLIKSGIGSIKDLRAAKVKPVVVSPQVGKNLQDHVMLSLNGFSVKDPSRAWSLVKNLSFSDIDEFLHEGKGHVGLAGPSGGAYVSSQRGRRENPNWPDLQLNYIFHQLDVNALDCLILLGRPYSRGTLRFNASATSMEDNNLPIIDFRYLEDRSDVDVMLDGIDYCFKIFEGTQAFRDIGAEYAKEPIQPCRNTAFRSKEYWICFIRQRATTFYHYSGTCRMGKANDIDGSVVDSHLRVHGVEKLRVIDASIMPRVTNANTAAAVYLIAEKAAATIIEDYKKSRSCLSKLKLPSEKLRLNLPPI